MHTTAENLRGFYEWSLLLFCNLVPLMNNTIVQKQFKNFLIHIKFVNSNLGSHPLLVTPDPAHTQLWFETQPEGFTRSVFSFHWSASGLHSLEPADPRQNPLLNMQRTTTFRTCLPNSSQAKSAQWWTYMYAVFKSWSQNGTCIFARWTPVECRNYPWETSRTFLSCWKWVN